MSICATQPLIVIIYIKDWYLYNICGSYFELLQKYDSNFNFVQMHKRNSNNNTSCRVSEYRSVYSELCDYNSKLPHNSYLTQDFFFLKMNSNLSLHKIQILMLIRKKFFPEHSFSLKYSKNCFFATVNQSSYTPNSTKNPCDLSSRTNIPFMGPYIYIYNIYQTFSCKIHFLNIK